MYSVIGLDSHQSSSLRIEYVNARACSRHDVAILGDFQPIWYPVHCEIYKPFVAEVGSITLEIKSVDRAFAYLVERRALLAYGHRYRVSDSTPFEVVRIMIIAAESEARRRASRDLS